jgi:hypothetical protein
MKDLARFLIHLSLPEGAFMSAFRRSLAFLILGCACLASAQEMQEGRLMRFPDISHGKIAFY